MIPRLPGVGSELYGPFRCVSYAMGVSDGGKRGTGSRSPDATPLTVMFTWDCPVITMVVISETQRWILHKFPTTLFKVCAPLRLSLGRGDLS